ncbi:MAG TPA: hypothetical protein VH969_15140 [Actinophytocola sp.]|jgi:hypothetical protein|uniref:hypothetical protein n=1 Tax=Actinophytocola sp. TaxID=1872138 RepID=UPI002F949930
MTRERSSHPDLVDEVSGLSWHQEYRAARLVASSSADAADCAQLLAALGIHPADWPSLDEHPTAIESGISQTRSKP